MKRGSSLPRHRLFLDANVLFSAAWRAGAGVAALWTLRGVERITSAYAVEEARRNLPEAVQRLRLGTLLEGIALAPDAVLPRELADALPLPEKDRPILASALVGGATHLITGDVRHFGVLFGTEVHGVRILPPGRYLEERRSLR